MTAAARHPDAQAAVHDEIDAVVGNDRCPSPSILQGLGLTMNAFSAHIR